MSYREVIYVLIVNCVAFVLFLQVSFTAFEVLAFQYLSIRLRPLQPITLSSVWLLDNDSANRRPS